MKKGARVGRREGGKATRAASRRGDVAPRPRAQGKSRPRESATARRARVLKILERLKARFPDAHCELDYQNAYQLLVATILSAQCTDARVNMVTPALFARFPTPPMLAEADPTEVEGMIRSTGFFRNKTKSLIGMARAVVECHGGDVPRSMDELRPIPGVGRKTANVILGNAFGVNEGITVDTHVLRISRLLGLTQEADPEKVERDLMELVPQEEWTLVSHLLIWLGRRICIARRPRCLECPLNDLCPSANLVPA